MLKIKKLPQLTKIKVAFIFIVVLLNDNRTNCKLAVAVTSTY